MRKLILLSVLFALCALPMAAQDQPKVEIFGGYQYTHLEPSDNLHGWNASVAENLNNWFGVAADFSGAYESGGKLHTFMFGPVFSARQFESVTPFVHALFGGAVVSDGGSSTGFSMAFGGGFDVKVSDHIAVRLVQADWMPLHFEGEWVKKNARISAGLVFRF